MSQQRIIIKNVSKRFYTSTGEVCALRDVSLSLAPARTLALVGTTGAGKSVLLKLLAGLYAPDSGTIVFNTPHKKPRIGMLFQHNALFDSLPVWENIAFPLLVGSAENPMTRREARDVAQALLPRVGLPPDTADLSPSALSGGMQKRVGFARAIIAKPDILLLDNPTAGLDPILAARIDAMIGTLARESGASVISVTAHMAGLGTAHDDIAVLHEGVLYWHSAMHDTLDEGLKGSAWLRQILANPPQASL